MDTAQRDRIEAAAFRRLLAHLRVRTDVQNVDLMGEGGFCRNCLSDWIGEAAAAAGQPLGHDAAREWVYGMPYAAYKAAHQTPATPAQLEKMAASVTRNRASDTAQVDSVTLGELPASSAPPISTPLPRNKT